MILLDTNIVIWMLRGKKEVIDAIHKLSYTETTAISSMTIAEVYQNVLPQEMENTAEHLDTHSSLDIDKYIARAAGLYWTQYQKRLRKLGITDCIIAATARLYDCTLVTLNTRHFPMSDIKILNPLKSK